MNTSINVTKSGAGSGSASLNANKPLSCFVKRNKGRTRTKPHKATDINPYTVPLQLFLCAYIGRLKPTDRQISI
jgi:hypothetical protein